MRIFCLQTGEYKDASKNVRMYLRHSSNVIVDLWYMILNHFGVNHLISVVFTNWGPTDGRTDRRTDIASYRDAYDASKKGISIFNDH